MKITRCCIEKNSIFRYVVERLQILIFLGKFSKNNV